MKSMRILLAVLFVAAASASAQTVSTVFSGASEIHGITVDYDGNTYYFTESLSGQVIAYNQVTGFSTIVEYFDGELANPSGIVFSRHHGSLVVADTGHHQLKMIDPSSGVVTLLAGSTQGNADGAGNEAKFNNPTAIATDGAGNFYVADWNGIRRVSAEGDVTTIATGFNKCAGVAFESATKIWVADTLNHVIKRVDVDPVSGVGTNIVVVSGRVGVSGTTDSLNAYNGRFNQPRGLLWKAGVGLLIADSANNTIRRLYWNSARGTNSIETYAGTPGQAGLENGSLLASKFNLPTALTSDDENAFLVTDLKNSTLRKITLPGQPAPIVLPPSGAYSNAITATFETDPSIVPAIFNYTTNGYLPNSLDAVATSLKLDGRKGGVPLQVRCYSPMLAVSPTVSNYYGFFVAPMQVTPAGAISNDIVEVKVSTATDDAKLYWTMEKNTDPTNGFLVPANGIIRVQSNGVLKVVGVKDGYTNSAVFSGLYDLLVANPTIAPSGANTNNAVKVELATITPDARIYWTTNGDSPTAASNLYDPISKITISQSCMLKARAFRDGFVDSQIVAANFNLTVSDPVLTPMGQTTNNDVVVKISSATEGAIFYYGINEDPSILVVSNQVIVSQSCTLKVTAEKPGYASSQTVAASFDLYVADPVISPVGAVTNNNVLVRVTEATRDAKVFWSIGASEVTTNSTELVLTNSAGQFYVTNSGELKIKAFKPGYAESATVVANFDLKVATPVITPNGTNWYNDVEVTIASATKDLTEIRWTIDGTTPSETSGFVCTNGVPFVLSTNGTLKAIALKTGYAASEIASAVFNLQVKAPTISAPCSSSNNVIPVTLDTLSTNTIIVWTTDGQEPALPSLRTNRVFDLDQNGWLKVKAFRDGYAASATVSNFFSLRASTPVITPKGGTFINERTVQFTNETAGSEMYYTTDGRTPTTNDLTGTEITITTNTVLSVAAFRDGFVTSPVAVENFQIKVDAPVMNPPGGYFPNGCQVDLTVLRTNAQIYYTLNGQDPTTNDIPFHGAFTVDQVSFQGSDLRIVKARAFASNTLPSDVVVGQAFETNSIGVPRNMTAGVGSTIVVPVVANLNSESKLRSLQFRLEIAPVGHTNAAGDIMGLNISTNDFIPVVLSSSDNNPSSFMFAYYHMDYTSGVRFASIATNMLIESFGVVGNFSVPIPATAKVGDTYSVRVLEISGTPDAGQGVIALSALPSRTLTVTNIPYVAGDAAVGRWYNAGDFGDGDLINSDVNVARKASLGIGVPYRFTDAFDAMDVFPLDAEGIVGGDGEIRYLDWQTTLERSLRMDGKNWYRAWGADGMRTNWSATLPTTSKSALPKTKSRAVAPGMVWERQAVFGSETLTNAIPGQTYKLPVFVKIAPDRTVQGLQFRVVLQADGNAPTPGAIRFMPTIGFPEPEKMAGLAPNDLLCIWSIGSLPYALEGSNYLGEIEFQVPLAAQAGQSYTLHFVRPDGACDLQTQLDCESMPATVWVLSAANRPAELISDEWRTRFFGSLINCDGNRDADPDKDGMPNWQEYLAGTNPTNAFSRLHFMDSTRTGHGPALKWLTAPGKRYVLEGSDCLNSWSEITNVLGDGYVKEILDNAAAGQVRFYRIRLQQQ